MDKNPEIWWEEIDNFLIDISIKYDLTVEDIIRFFSYKLSSQLGKHQADKEDVKYILALIFERYRMFKKNLTKKKKDEME